MRLCFIFLIFFFIKFIGQASNSIFNRLGIAQVWWNNWHVNPIKRYYSNLLQRDFFLIKFIPLFFLYSIHISHYNFWGLSYFYILRNIKRIVSIYKRERFYRVKFPWKRYNFFKKSKFAFFDDRGSPVMTIPIKNRKALFRNFYFSKLWIMHIFGWLILKINILIPKKNLKNKIKFFVKPKYFNNNTPFSLKKKLKSFNFKYRYDQNRFIYKKKYTIVKNFFFFNFYLKSKYELLDSLKWF